MAKDEIRSVDTYSSVAGASEGLYKELGSRFMAFAYPVESEEEVKLHVDAIKKEYHDARHHCFAYRLGLDGARFRASDDGEPSGSAGRPILGQIDSAGLSDILVVVVRYFGGIKLGVPGLIRAYKTATADAIQNAQVVEKIAGRDWRISFPYLSMNSVMKLIKDMSLPQRDQDFGVSCAMTVRVRLAQESDFCEKAEKIEGACIEVI
ncbi:MAG: YigZ family protein [Bacteroidales bacterium]|nr:YigZ family protein [Bacteroidales bacterium]